MDELRYEKPRNRIAEIVIGIVGSIFGIIGGISTLMVASANEAVGNAGSSDIYTLGIIVILMSIATFIISCLIKRKRVLMSILLIIAGVLDFFLIGIYGIIAGILILAAGVLALLRK
ncbi:DUF4064 domain-containing protein [Staphylococcus simulans]|uniref:DUF4064 domain-containing protein n=1 Tax=Staphylococcus simulans TaxID=1286 RepID=UPI00076AEEC7|nr:DUF4064 domain-containing protein [Staphylococcus simulans]AMG97362.1 DUF4064 domain-containing protein [Staphylococcus simulans]